AILFDLDGTLADTLEDIAQAANHALTALGQPARPVKEFRYLAGQGLQWLMDTALGEAHRHLTPRGMELFRAFYKDHSFDHTGPYAGIPELLDELTARGVTMAVLSNKPHSATQQVMARLFARWKFAVVRGAMDGVPLKPDPAAAVEIVKQCGIPAEKWLYLGDTKVDMETASRAGMTPMGVLWGFRDEAELRESGAKVIVSHPGEVAGHV
ncbi:MAG: HAD family hydrolase, partial [Phycisphaeraceae bacterium]|nr:HAD family hydrolase [Phycisphaeraceae bacterium]